MGGARYKNNCRTQIMEEKDGFVANIVSGAIEKEKESLKALSHEIWSNPELNYEEVFAHKVLTDYLEGKGFAVDREFCNIKTAFRARYGVFYFRNSVINTLHAINVHVTDLVSSFSLQYLIK